MMPRLTLRRCVCGSWHGTSLKEIMVRGASCRFTEISSRACRLVSGPWKMNIVKEEPALGGLSVEYTDYPDIRKRLAEVLGAMRRRPWENYDIAKLTKYFSHDLAALWKIHAFREGNTRTTIHFCCQFADEHGFPIDRQLFEENSHYVRTALVAYNAVFSDIGDKSQKQYLEMFIRDGIEGVTRDGSL